MPDICHWFRCRLRTLLLITFVICAGVAFCPPLYWFIETGGQTVELAGTIEFVGQDLPVVVTPEVGCKWPSLRQRRLISRVERYEDRLWEEIKDVAFQNLTEFENLVGDMTNEYGLPEMDRRNIDQFFTLDAVWITKQSDSADDYVGLCFGCDWENEHGMYMLLRNGEIVWHGWDYSQWYRKSGYEEMNGPGNYGIKLK